MLALTTDIAEYGVDIMGDTVRQMKSLHDMKLVEVCRDGRSNFHAVSWSKRLHQRCLCSGHHSFNAAFDYVIYNSNDHIRTGWRSLIGHADAAGHCRSGFL